VTTFALLAFVLLAEVRAEPSVHVMGRRLSTEVQRQAVTVALLGVGVVMVSALVLLATTSFRLDAVLVETTAAFGGVGMSAGITPQLPPAGQLVIIVLMFIGRVGPITLVSSLALRERRRRYELPEERPIVG
jgi:Trk-type K+ transport system membrane component